MNCWHCHVGSDYDDPPRYFCALDGKPMPPDLIKEAVRGEGPMPDLSSEMVIYALDGLRQDREQWEKERHVSPCGICESYRPCH